MKVAGKVSWFGGPPDLAEGGISADEPLAFIYEVTDRPQVFLPGAKVALAQCLDPEVYYIACRWDYDNPEQTREMLLTNIAWVRSPETGMALPAYPADWGPHVDTGRVADISPGLMEDLGIMTDDEVEVIFPAPMRRSVEEVLA